MAITRDSKLFKKVVNYYWNYYRELEDEFLQTRRYVDFSEKNFTTFSVEYLKLYQAVCSEIDVLGKAMATIADSNFVADDKQNNILKWWFIIQDKFFLSEEPFTLINPTNAHIIVGLKDYECYLLGNYSFKPWENFVTEQRTKKNNSVFCTNATGSTTPLWWKDYNSVKHNRISIDSQMANYEKANLKNLSYAFAALYVLEKALLDTIGEKDDTQTFMDYSRLFVIRRGYTYSEMDQLFKLE